MRPFTSGYGKDETCPDCGAIFGVEIDRDPCKSRTFAKCDDCGKVLKECYDTYTYFYTLKSHGPTWRPPESGR